MSTICLMAQPGQVDEKKMKSMKMAAAKAAKLSPAKEEPILYRNNERYADPTAFYAMQNIVREQRKPVTRAYPRTQVVRYA